MKLFMAGTDVTEGLVKVFQTDESKPYKRPEVKFGSVSVVYVKNERYVMRPLIGRKGGDCVIRVNNGFNCTIQFQSPGNSGLPSLIKSAPVLTYGEVILLAILTVLISLLAN